MQCLMMDSSFSMVTMQDEDSGIAWETTLSRCNTPWASEAGKPSVDYSSPVAAWPATPGSHPAGRIIFVMDEGLMSRQKKAKDSGRRSKAEGQRDILAESSDNLSARQELIEVSKPNVKCEEEEDEEQLAAPVLDKEQMLFSLVSEGSEILNIVVPPKLATVDEEESKEMVDNLSYLQENVLPEASEPVDDNVSELNNKLLLLTNAPPGLVQPDPMIRPPDRVKATNVDYFEAFALVDAQAPGSPAVVAHRRVELETEEAAKVQEPNQPVKSKDRTTTATMDKMDSDAISLDGITSELLDEVFYAGTELMKGPLDRADGCGVDKVSRLPMKPSGSTLFGSQEDILTPIFLPDGPSKIIDPILMEEPKAMAFLYTDLYEEALGSRQKQEDTESVTSEKSFHSRYSDREARGYLEKYVLIDETPALEVPADQDKAPHQGPRLLSQNVCDFTVFFPKPEKPTMANTEEEITDFFRSSANSSPCDVEALCRSEEDDGAQSNPKTKANTKETPPVTQNQAILIPFEPLGESNCSPEEPDWVSFDDHLVTLDEKDVPMSSDQQMWKQDMDMLKPVAPPRRKATSSPKVCLDLTPLTRVDISVVENEAGLKEQKEEEKETASPAETADEEEGDGDEATETPQTENVKDSEAAAAEETTNETTEEERRVTDAASEASSESFEAETKEGGSAALTTEPAEPKGHCVIL